MIEHISHGSEILAYILRNDFHKEGVSFFTPNNYSQQLGYMSHPKGKVIQAHSHNSFIREVKRTQEVLIIKEGKLRVDLYGFENEYLESRILNAGDIILLASGGHGFEVIEDVRMVEIKQGPYSENIDKQKINTVLSNQIRIKN